MKGSELFLKPVRLLINKLVHVANGDIQRAARLAPEVVPSANPPGLLPRLLWTAVLGVQVGAKLGKMVHEFVLGAQVQDTRNVSFAGIIEVDGNELAERRG